VFLLALPFQLEPSRSDGACLAFPCWLGPSRTDGVLGFPFHVGSGCPDLTACLACLSMLAWVTQVRCCLACIFVLYSLCHPALMVYLVVFPSQLEPSRSDGACLSFPCWLGSPGSDVAWLACPCLLGPSRSGVLRSPFHVGWGHPDCARLGLKVVATGKRAEKRSCSIAVGTALAMSLYMSRVATAAMVSCCIPPSFAKYSAISSGQFAQSRAGTHWLSSGPYLFHCTR
jgi:hypothetical protein